MRYQKIECVSKRNPSPLEGRIGQLEKFDSCSNEVCGLKQSAQYECEIKFFPSSE